MKEKDYYTFAEIWELYDQIEAEIGCEELAGNICRYIGMEKTLEALKSIATDFDLWDYEEE